MSEQRRNRPLYSLLVGGDEYSGWTSMRVTRGLERCCSDFELQVSERWGLEDETWQIQPGETCEIKFEDELVLTGYVDAYRPSYDAGSHSIRLTGRSKTCDFVDSSILVDGGQFAGLTVGQIAAELARPFGIEVLVEQDGPPEAEVQVQQGETNFALVERLARLQELLVTDDANGRLVLTRAGNTQAASALRHGENIKTASAELDNSQRFSDYIVKAQRPGNSKKSKDDAQKPGPGSIDWQRSAVNLRTIPNVSERYRQRMLIERARSSKRGNPKSLTQIGATVKDPDITRYRPHVIVAEAQGDDADCAKRAEWECRRRIAKAIRATISVNGWRQTDGALWATNLMVDCEAPWLALERELIIAQVQFSYDSNGALTTLELTLPDAFLPEAKRKGKKGKGEGGKKAGKKKASKGGSPFEWAGPDTSGAGA